MRKQTSDPSGWLCPECGRRFTRRTREHSCQVRSVESHLARTSPEIRAAFLTLQGVLACIGPCTITPVKTMILFSRMGNFGGVTLTRTRIDLGFFLARPLTHERITRVERLSPVKFANHVDLRTPSDVDQEVVGWLTEAYESLAPSRRAPS